MVPPDIPTSRGSDATVASFSGFDRVEADARAVHIGFIAKSETEVRAFYRAAKAAGATDNGQPGTRLYQER
jgi:hypothetical protein